MAGFLTNSQIFRYTLIAALLVVNVMLTAQELSTRNRKAKDLYNEARYLVRRKAFDMAQENLLKALNRDEDFMEAQRLLAFCYYMTGDRDLSWQQYLLLLENHGANALDTSNYYFVGDLLFGQGQFKESARYLEAYRAYDKKKYYEQDAVQILRAIAYNQANQSDVVVQAEKLPREINAFPLQYFPVLTGDSKRILFTRRLSADLAYDEDIVICVKLNDSTWSTPYSISPEINTPLNEGTCTISADTRFLIFTSCMKRDTQGSCDLYISERNGNTWCRPVNLGSTINSPHWESQPSLSADGRQLYFVSDRPGGMGGLDIWVSTKNEEGWTTPRNPGAPLNTPADEMSPSIHADGQTLFFASNGHPGFGSFDIFMMNMLDPGEPLNLGMGINDLQEQTGFFVTADGLWGYFSNMESSDNDFQKSDIYRVSLEGRDFIPKVNYVYGKVVDKESGRGLKAEVNFRGLETDSLIYSFKTDPNGDFLAMLPDSSSWGIYAESKGYLPTTRRFDHVEDSILIPLDIVKKDAVTTLENIFFEFDSYTLLPESKASLQEVVRFLTYNPAVRIRVEGHTDKKGEETYNLQLSQKRAEEVLNYLIDQGIKPERLEAVGYGENKPLNPDKPNVNRRIELRIL